MLIPKYTSLKEVIMNVYRNTGSDREVNIDDLAYWSYEALEGIGYPLTYIPKVYGHKEDTSWEFEDYKVKLPADFHKLRMITVDGIAAVPASNTFHELLDGSCCGWDAPTNGAAVETYWDNFGNQFSPNAAPLTQPQRAGLEAPSFSMNNSYVTFNVESGIACMAYWAFPVDDEGFPMIPDLHEVKMAVAYYLQERLDYKLWRKGVLSGEVYKDAKRERNWYMAQAYSQVRVPDEHQMEVMKNMMLKMIVRKDDYLTSFRNLNKQGNRGRY